jgi:hypothetical protein
LEGREGVAKGPIMTFTIYVSVERSVKSIKSSSGIPVAQSMFDSSDVARDHRWITQTDEEVSREGGNKQEKVAPAAEAKGRRNAANERRERTNSMQCKSRQPPASQTTCPRAVH